MKTVQSPPNSDTQKEGERRGVGGVGGWGERERVAGQETSSADEVIGLKIKRWRHLKPIPVNELSGAPGKGGDRRGQGGGRRAGPCARPSPERGSAPGRGRSGRGRVPFRSGARRLRDRFRGRRWEEPGGPGRRPRGLLLRPRARRPPPGPLISPTPDPRGRGSAARLQRCAPTGISGCSPPPAPRRPSEAQSLFRLLGLFPAASPA